MTKSCHIRAASAADLPAIEHILVVNDLASNDIDRHLTNFLIAEREGTIVGTIGLEIYGTIGLLRSAAVLPSHRNQGIGAKLVSGIERRAKGQGVKELFLLTTTAARYFANKGFSRVERNRITGEVLSSSQFNGACPSTAASMWKKL